ncbi:DUF2891 family protein [Mariniluteicoccus flavus]
MTDHDSPLAERAEASWKDAYAQPWAETVVRVLTTPFPWASTHVSLDADDCDVTPWKLHPSFHASLDWHSSCHMQWSGITLLDRASDHIDEATRTAITAQLDERLTVANAQVEADYLRRHPRFERPYGWGWAAMLAVAARDSAQPNAAQWAEATAIIADAVADNLVAWMPKLVYPVRTGQHDNTAFGVALCRDAFGALGRTDVVEAIDENARRWFLADRDYPVSYEPSGNDFLSAALSEADLMRRVLPRDEFDPWLTAFLPRLAFEGDILLDVPEVIDRTDGKLVHLFGLVLARAAQLRALAPHCGREQADRIAERTPGMIAEVEREIIEGDFMSTHWLVSFALLAVL